MPALGRRPDPAAAELAGLQERLAEAEETLRAIRNGEVDALVVSDESPKAQVFTLSTADRPYRMFVESMRDGAATVSDAGVVLYANRRLAELLACPLHRIIGSQVESIIAERDRPGLHAIGDRPGAGGTMEAELLATDGAPVQVRINSSTLDVDHHKLLCLTFADLTEQKAHELEIYRLSQADAQRARQLEEAQAALTAQATHDALTGLPNRDLLIDRVTQALSHSERAGTTTGLLFVALDNFKAVNDSRGRDAADSVLCQVGERLLTVARSMDTVARLGGDEFVVLVPGLDGPAQAVAVGERIGTVLADPIRVKGATVSIKASMGITVSDPAVLAELPTADRLLLQAGTATYRAKSLGGGRTEIFDADSALTLEADRETWISRIRAALDEERLVLYTQPIVDLATGDALGEELLLRMLERNGDVVPPLAFLPTAERCGLISEIDRWVISRGIALAAAGRRVSINLSASSAGDPAILELIEREIDANGTDPSDLIFEITETAIMEDTERAGVFAAQLIALGCRFALDDFGTGFASFTYLKRLPVQYLKIDLDFVRNLLHSPRDVAVVKAIVALARDFGQETIAEGVEDQESADFLRELGVTFAQGYLFGRPSPIGDA